MTATLEPLAYHVEIAARLEALEPASWAAIRGAVDAAVTESARSDAAVAAAPATADDPIDLALLRSADRLEPAAHPRVHAAAARASTALGVTTPLVIYQLEGGERPDLSLVHRPNEAVIAVAGRVLSLLSDDELTAAFGHELAHHRLWSLHDGRFLVAARLLAALGAAPSTPAPYLETARRFNLAGELYADRGAVLACGSLEVAVASLVKVATGLAEVDARAYLAQAEAARPETGSPADSHPETTLRARALARWHAGSGSPGRTDGAQAGGAEAAAERVLAPGLDIERLDLLDRERLEAATRAVLLDVLRIDWWGTDTVLAHARQFFPDMNRDEVPPPVGPPAKLPAGASDATLRYLAFVLLDLATVDPDLEDEPLPLAVALARAIGLGPAFESVARQELAMGDRAWQGVLRNAADLVPLRSPEAPADAATTPVDRPSAPVALTLPFPDA